MPWYQHQIVGRLKSRSALDASALSRYVVSVLVNAAVKTKGSSSAWPYNKGISFVDDECDFHSLYIIEHFALLLLITKKYALNSCS